MGIPLPRGARKPRLYPYLAIQWTMMGNWRRALHDSTTTFGYGRKVKHYRMRGRHELSDLCPSPYHFRLGKVIDPG